MIKPRILVTSAAGRTGSAAVFQLLEKGFPVRALVRRDDHRSAKLRQAGAEVIIGNQLDFRDLQKALVDVKRAWHIPPFAPNLLHGASLFALAAEEAKLEVVALMSGWNPHATHPSVATREHWVSNNIYQWMPSVDVIYVNPGLFAFVYLLGLPLVSQLGMLALPYGDGRNAPPSNEDIARVAVSLLENPESHTGKSYRPTGPKLIDGHEIATILSRVLGRKVRYQHVSTEMFIRVATAQGFPPFEISQMRYYAHELRRGAFEVGAPTNHVYELSGYQPEDFETIVRRYVQGIDTNVSLIKQLRAIGLLAKAMFQPLPNMEQWEQEHQHPLLQNSLLAPDSPTWRSAAENYRIHLLNQAIE